MQKPQVVDMRGKLPTANPQNIQHRALAGISLFVVHYSDENAPDGYDVLEYMRGEARFHINKNWAAPGQPPLHGFGLQYTYQVDRKGVLYQIWDEDVLTWSHRNANAIGIACCFHLGEHQQPTVEQITTLYNLSDWLMFERPDLPHLNNRGQEFGHGELTQYGNATNCPGGMLPYVLNYRAGKLLLPGGGTAEVAARTFPNGFSVAGKIRADYERTGDVTANGLPISQEVPMTFPGIGQLTVQYFERSRIEIQPDGSTTHGLVGVEAMEAWEDKGGN